MIAETVYGHNLPEVGITPRYAPDALGYRYLVGERHWGRVRVYWCTEPTHWGEQQALVHLGIHSVALNWGYCGQGCQDLAYSVLVAMTGSGRIAHALYHQFCAEKISGIEHQGFVLPVREIRAWLREHEGQVA